MVGHEGRFPFKSALRATIVSCAHLECFKKLDFILLCIIKTIQLQFPPLVCSWMLTLIANCVILLDRATSAVLARFGSQISCTRAGCFKYKQSLIRCKSRYQVLGSSLRSQSKKKTDTGNKLQPGSKACCVNVARCSPSVIFLTSFPYVTNYYRQRVAVAPYLILGGAEKGSIHMSQHTSTGPPALYNDQDSSNGLSGLFVLLY